MEVEVVEKGKPGILGIGMEEARVIVRRLSERKSEEKDVASLAKETLEKLLSLMDIDAQVQLQMPIEAAESSPMAILDITGEDLGILIGRRGETLAALQYTINLILSRQLKTRVSVAIDVEGYQKRRQDSLRNLALRMAERAKATGQTMTLEPMPAKERRIVHLVLADDPLVTTESVGIGESRKITIYLKKE